MSNLDQICLACPLPECDESSPFCGRAHAILRAGRTVAERKPKAYSQTENAKRCRAYYDANRERERARKRQDYYAKIGV